MTYEMTTDLAPFYRPRHSAPALRAAAPARSDWGWSRRLLPAARFVGELLLDVATVAVTFVVFLLLGSAAFDYIIWRR